MRGGRASARTRARRLTAAALGMLLSAAPVGAQSDLLRDAEARLAEGDLDSARALVRQWWAADDRGRTGGERARGLHLRARLAVDARAAEEDYMALALGHPTSPQTPLALLRLGQLLLALGEPARSEAYLKRLVYDYPGHDLHAEAYLWLARARRAAGREAEACQAVAAGRRRAASDPDLRGLLGVEDARCLDRAAPAPVAAAPDPDARYSVQVGAYRVAGSASALYRHLKSIGLDPRLVTMPGSGLFRLRVGRFREAEDAAVLRLRLVTEGFEAVVVDDVLSETPARP